MRRAFRALLLLTGACLSGVICGELLSRWPTFRSALGQACGHGQLLAVVGGRGLYERDLELRPGSDLPKLIADENLRSASREEAVREEDLAREMQLLRDQFADEQAFARAMQASGLTLGSLREKAADFLRGCQWLEKQIADESKTSEIACRQFYEAHREHFVQPARYRVSHLFLAAPQEVLPEVIAAKEKEIQILARRISKGELLGTLAAEASEDEATKLSGGDLGFISSQRMSPEFFREVEKLKPGQITGPFRTPLGFHIVQLTEAKPAREMSFGEAQREIARTLTNAERVSKIARLTGGFAMAEFVRPIP